MRAVIPGMEPESKRGVTGKIRHVETFRSAGGLFQFSWTCVAAMPAPSAAMSPKYSIVIVNRWPVVTV